MDECRYCLNKLHEQNYTYSIDDNVCNDCIMDIWEQENKELERGYYRDVI